MTTLYVGDPHATVEELDDCEALVGLVHQTVMDYDVSRVVFLGDMHNNFAVTNVRVTAFWREAFATLKKCTDVLVLVGNHDMLGNGQPFPHALLAYADQVTVVDGHLVDDGVLYLPYYSDPNLFIETVRSFSNVKQIVCHQEFNGAQYDNGFFAPHGVDPNLMQVPVISGHIHTPQRLGNVWYPGAPRWRTLSDAATIERHLYVVSEKNGTIAIPTSPHVKVIHDITITPETSHIVHLFAKKDEYRIHVEGPATFVKEQLSKLSEYGHANKRISSTTTDARVIRVRESDGIDVAFNKYLDSFKPKNGTTKEVLSTMVANRL